MLSDKDHGCFWAINTDLNTPQQEKNHKVSGLNSLEARVGLGLQWFEFVVFLSEDLYMSFLDQGNNGNIATARRRKYHGPEVDFSDRKPKPHRKCTVKPPPWKVTEDNRGADEGVNYSADQFLIPYVLEYTVQHLVLYKVVDRNTKSGVLIQSCRVKQCKLREDQTAHRASQGSRPMHNKEVKLHSPYLCKLDSRNEAIAI
ncbi:hypothetical protein J6590_045817 [Homalodisca vitripennis]|nr:hypothetical protein J6590_045817 [Homalodisca vitripennis]